MNRMKCSMKFQFLLLMVSFLLPAVSLADSLPVQVIVKDGSCPSGYRTSGKYCVPGSNAGFAIRKVGSCPSGYRTSGKYCIANKNAQFAIIKSGSCPSGYRTSGKYCIGKSHR